MAAPSGVRVLELAVFMGGGVGAVMFFKTGIIGGSFV
jgi:hypothetical protein